MTTMGKPHTIRGVDETWLSLWRVYGVDRATLIWDSLNSAYDRLLFAHHHLLLLRKLVQPAVTQGLEANGLLGTLSNDDDVEALFSQSMHQVKMHGTDCIQHMHAVGDTVAFAVHFFVGFPVENQLEKRDITLPKVRKLLGKHSEFPGAESFLKLLNELAADGSYTYISDLNNHAKHRSIVRPAVSHAFDSEIPENELKNLLVFPLVEMSRPPLELQNRGATPCHGQHSIVPLIESELTRIWNIYGELRREVEEQIRASPSNVADTPAHRG